MNFLTGESVTSDQGNGPSKQKEGWKFWISPETFARASDPLADRRDTAGRGLADPP